MTRSCVLLGTLAVAGAVLLGAVLHITTRAAPDAGETWMRDVVSPNVTFRHTPGHDDTTTALASTALDLALTGGWTRTPTGYAIPDSPRVPSGTLTVTDHALTYRTTGTCVRLTADIDAGTLRTTVTGC